jgi:peptidoglycan/LPS O-acetylase OafA/YrhL
VLAEDFRAKSLPVIPTRIGVAAVASALYWATLNTVAGYYITLNVFAILVFFWVRNEINGARRPNWLDGVGSWSYSIYLFHVIAAAYVARVTTQPMVRFAVAFALCYVAYRAVEDPAHRLARMVFSVTRRRALSG